jgi:hypothetical protein
MRPDALKFPSCSPGPGEYAMRAWVRDNVRIDSTEAALCAVAALPALTQAASACLPLVTVPASTKSAGVDKGTVQSFWKLLEGFESLL